MVEIFINLCEEVLAYILLKNVTLPAPLKKRRQIAGIFILTTMVSILTFLNINSSIRMLISLLMQMIYAYTCFEASRFEKLLWGSSYTVIAVLSDRITFRIADVVNDFDIELLTKPGIVRYQMAVIYLLCSAVIVYLLIKFKKNRLYLPSKYQMLLLAVTAPCLVVLDKLLDLSIVLSGNNVYNKVEMLINAICVLLFAIILFTWYTIISLAGVYYERERLKNAQLLRNHEAKELESMRNMVGTLRTWKHDFRNHLQVIRGLMLDDATDDAILFLDKIYGEIEQNATFLCSGDSILDVIVSSKIIAARNQGIRFEHEIHLEEPLHLNETQKSSVLGNLLDNAIEANLYVVKEERHIKLVIKSFGDDQLIVVRNSCDGNFIWEGGNLVSRKKEEGHGQGIKIIQRIVNEENGICEIIPGKDSFEIKIII